MLINLNNLEILKTLNTLASYGPILKNLEFLEEFEISRRISIIEAITTKASNLFQVGYDIPLTKCYNFENSLYKKYESENA